MLAFSDTKPRIEEEVIDELTYVTKPTRKLIATRVGEKPREYELDSTPVRIRLKAPVYVSSNVEGDNVSWTFRSTLYKSVMRTREGASYTIRRTFLTCRSDEEVVCESRWGAIVAVEPEEWYKIRSY